MSLESPLITQLQELNQKVDVSLNPYFEDLIQLTEKKLWHQVTLKVEEIVKIPAMDSQILLQLYFNFVDALQGKLNQIKFVSIAIAIAHHCQGKEEAINFLRGIANKVNNVSSQDAYILAKIEIAHQILLSGAMTGVKEIVEEAMESLKKLSQVETVIHAHYYRVASEYFKACGDFSKYYYNSLLFLSCININDLTHDDKLSRAYDLSLAALLGDTIYNFGELLSHPISEVLKGTEHEWLYKLLLVFNSGEIGKLDSLSPHFNVQPLLEQHMGLLKQKIILMGLMEYIFRLKNNNSLISFKNISVECQIPINEVEHLIMKALALDLIRGSIDQVDSKVNIHWVQPRYLDKVQLNFLGSKLDFWKSKVEETSNQISQLNPDLTGF